VIRTLVVDDQELVRSGFCAMLEARDDIEVVGEAGDGAEAVEQARLRHPDVVLMDIRMPGMDGIEATRRLMAGPDPPRVLILTTFDADEYVYEAMRAGAAGFLLKDTSSARLADGIRTVAAGEALLAPSVTKRLVEHFVRRPAAASTAAKEAFAELTERELDILLQVARGHSNGEIASALFLSEATVKTHVTRILAKLGLRGRVQAVVLAYESGLVEPGGER
jgi:DNA-binding NarL/FixJ family response regulator